MANIAADSNDAVSEYKPWKMAELAPVGSVMASWSRVTMEPPALRMRARALSVTRRAATFNLGTVRKRLSSVTVPTTTTVLLAALAAWLC